MPRVLRGILQATSASHGWHISVSKLSAHFETKMPFTTNSAHERKKTKSATKQTNKQTNKPHSSHVIYTDLCYVSISCLALLPFTIHRFPSAFLPLTSLAHRLLPFLCASVSCRVHLCDTNRAHSIHLVFLRSSDNNITTYVHQQTALH